jgi:lysozyme
MTYPTRPGCVLGLDASKYQGKLDWKTLADSGVRFAVLKATEGATITDSGFIPNVISAGSEPRIRVVCPYHFLVATSDPVAQAQSFWNQAGRYPVGRPVIDFETEALQHSTYQEALDRLLACLDYVEYQWGCPPILYTARGYLAAIGHIPGALDRLSKYDLWVAQWSGSNPIVPAPWTKTLLWQFDGDGGLKLPNGVDADFDWFQGTEDELVAALSRSVKDGL